MSEKHRLCPSADRQRAHRAGRWGSLAAIGAVAGGIFACRGAPPGEQPPWSSDSGESLDSSAAGAPHEPPTAAASSGGARALAPSDADDAVLGAGGEGAALDCGGDSITLAEAHSGRVRTGVRVALEPLLASSQKFLLSEAKSGSCLWGAMAAHPTRQGRGSGLMLVSFGAPHGEGESCQPGSDGLPDDLVPGDELYVEGTLDDFVPAACGQVAAALQLRLDAACPARRGARKEPPAPALIDASTATEIARGASAQLLREWGGALVRLEDVSAARDDNDGDAIFPYGVMHLEQTELEVHSRIYYFDLSEGGPRAAGKAPRFEHPLSLTSVSGHVFLDYCTWALAPRSVCTDFAPPAAGCSR